MSIRNVWKKHRTSKSLLERTKQCNHLKTYNKKKVQKKTKKQAIRRARLLYKHLVAQELDCIIMDDETYIKINFCTEPAEVLEDSVTAIVIEKFGVKILVWQTIC